MRAPGPRPAGADNYLRWRRTIDEHLELRRITWDEYAMFSWLCTKADPRTGTLRTRWTVLAEQTGLSRISESAAPIKPRSRPPRQGPRADRDREPPLLAVGA